jgi:hypothetical protein
MIQHETPVDRFFEAFQRASNSDDILSMVSHFAEAFLAAGPRGAQCVRSADFAKALPKRKQLFHRLGCQPATLVSLQQTPLDNRYVMAKTTWRFDFARGNHQMGEVLVDSTYLLDTSADEFKIVLYLTHQDIMEVLRERGILDA